jgi:hypothetical protein
MATVGRPVDPLTTLQLAIRRCGNSAKILLELEGSAREYPFPQFRYRVTGVQLAYQHGDAAGLSFLSLRMLVEAVWPWSLGIDPAPGALVLEIEFTIRPIMLT